MNTWAFVSTSKFPIVTVLAVRPYTIYKLAPCLSGIREASSWLRVASFGIKEPSSSSAESVKPPDHWMEGWASRSLDAQVQPSALQSALFPRSAKMGGTVGRGPVPRKAKPGPRSSVAKLS